MLSTVNLTQPSYYRALKIYTQHQAAQMMAQYRQIRVYKVLSVRLERMQFKTLCRVVGARLSVTECELCYAFQGFPFL